MHNDARSLYAVATRLLEALRSAQRLEGAAGKSALLGVREDAALLNAEIARFRNGVEADRELCTRKLRQIEDELARSRSSEQNLHENSDRLSREVTENERRAVDSEREAQRLSSALNDLLAGVEERKRKLDELQSWWWVPGYGTYLAIRTLVDDDITQIDRMRDALREAQHSLGRAHYNQSAARSELAALHYQLRQIAESRSTLAKATDLLRAEHLRQGHNWEFATQAVLFSEQLSAATHQADSAADLVTQLFASMNASVPMPALDGASLAYGPLGEALLAFARACDDADDLLFNPMATIAAFPLLGPQQLGDVVGLHTDLVVAGGSALRASEFGGVSVSSDGAYVCVTEVRGLQPSRFTMTIEFRPQSPECTGTILSVGNAAVSAAVESGGVLVLAHRTPDGAIAKIRSSSPVRFDGWQELKLRFDTHSRTIAFFIDDRRYCTAESALHLAPTDRALTFGADSNGQFRFNGSLREIRIKTAAQELPEPKAAA